MASSFTITVSSRSFRNLYPGNNRKRFTYPLDIPLDLTKGYEVAVVEQQLFFDQADFQKTDPHNLGPLHPIIPTYLKIMTNLIHPRRFEDTYLPVIQLWEVGVSPSVVTYMDCVPKLFSTLEFGQRQE